MIDSIFLHYRLTELWDFPLILIVLLLSAFYIAIVGPYRQSTIKGDVIPLKQKVYFLTGLLVTLVILGSPLHVLGHTFLFSIHMFQQAMLYMVVVPLLLLGIPQQVYKLVVTKQWLKRVVIFFTHPIISIFFFNGLFSIYHHPLVFETAVANHSLFTLFHIILFIGASLMWWSLLSPLPELNRVGELSRIGYIFMSGALITPVCALIIFSTSPIYSVYLEAPQLFSFLPTLEDQRLGGIIMKIIQEGVFISSIAVIFFKWAKKERIKEPSLDKAV
ncbi:cytochrome c oxidase assembly protein [Halalkalibacter urbisdiaboli]|uniref:cytochrome c oxidase assembly protein n=1 Tax=Halalkalibacter urbisdiaboli TaxID=1960589 RepID=UPI000B43A447|nr:cytochrome c oxidase assembly protein [Halalkalibacter urbisdiaboli]